MMVVRQSGRVRKTPTKFSNDDDSLGDSPRAVPLITTWDEDGLRAFYNAVIQDGVSNWKKIATACGRTASACQKQFDAHAAFLQTIRPETSALMWSYFLSAVNQASHSAPTGTLPTVSMPARAHPPDHVSPARTGKRTPRPRSVLDSLPEETTPEKTPSRRRRLDFNSAAHQSIGSAPPSGLDMLAAIAANTGDGCSSSPQSPVQQMHSLNSNPHTTPSKKRRLFEKGEASGSQDRYNGGTDLYRQSPSRLVLPNISEEASFVPHLRDGMRACQAQQGDAHDPVLHLGESCTDDEQVTARGDSQNGARAFEGGASDSNSPRRQRSRKSPPERLPISLMHFRNWLMLGSTGTQLDSHGVQHPPIGETGMAMTEQEQKLRHCLNLRTRRWCQFEFMTSAIDRPHWSKGGVPDVMKALGLKGVKKMKRMDVSLVRGALGCPRRLTDSFLYQERCALHAHRERCRSAYQKRHAVEGTLLPPDIPTQCHVGQHVVARHPQLRTLHDGDVLTVHPSNYMVQFNRSELGVWKIADIDVMPQNPFLNLPPAMRLDPPSSHMQGRSPPNDLHEDDSAAMAVPEVGDDDLEMMAEVASLIDKKSVLLAELRDLNSAASVGTGRYADGRYSDEFQNHYARTVFEVKRINQTLEKGCENVKRRVDELMKLKAMVTRTTSTTVTNPLSSEEMVTTVAGHIVEESMAEAAALVRDLVAQQRKEPENSAAAKDRESEQRALALYVDDETLIQMSTKLTAMFIAIQRCAASGQDGRTVQRALIRMVADLKPASHANTPQYQVITKNVSRLASHLGAR